MRFHAVVHDHNNDNEAVFECHVIADSKGAAISEVQKYLQENGREQQVKMLITLLEYREDIETELPLIKP